MRITRVDNSITVPASEVVKCLREFAGAQQSATRCFFLQLLAENIDSFNVEGTVNAPGLYLAMIHGLSGMSREHESEVLAAIPEILEHLEQVLSKEFAAEVVKFRQVILGTIKSTEGWVM